MAASKEALCNMALDHLGGTAVVITTLATDTTLEGKALRAFYETAKRETLLAHPWNVAQTQRALTLIEEITAEPMEWVYKYRLPEDCLMPQRICRAGIRTPPSGYRVPYRLMRDTVSTTYDAAVTYTVGQYAQSAGIWYRALRTTINDTPASSASDWVAVSTYNGVPPQWLLTDEPDAILEYTMDITDVREFTPDLDTAVAARLAFYVAPKISTSNPQLRSEMAQLWDLLIRQAEGTDANNAQRDPEPPSSFELARLS